MGQQRSEERPAKQAKTMSGDPTVVSAPGKVMVAGGYVVLERPNAALVAAISARVYCVVTSTAPGEDGVKVRVESPQLEESRSFAVSAAGAQEVAIKRADEMPRNPYIETTIVNTLALISHLHGAESLRDTVIEVRLLLRATSHQLLVRTSAAVRTRVRLPLAASSGEVTVTRADADAGGAVRAGARRQRFLRSARRC